MTSHTPLATRVKTLEADIEQLREELHDHVLRREISGPVELSQVKRDVQAILRELNISGAYVR